MSLLRAHNIAVSLDGFMAGPEQALDTPMGKGGMALHQWAMATRSFRAAHGGEGGEEGLDDEVTARADVGIGATIMGRNMFGPVRGDWGDLAWTGWWGASPPYHHDVFVLTHHPRDPLVMEGGTTFHFVTTGIEDALSRAREAAQGKDVRLGGGAQTLRQYLRAGLLDRLHLAVVPVLLGSGERLLDGIGTGYAVTEQVSSAAVTHVTLQRTVT
jgi:dihydrofolate reductase